MINGIGSYNSYMSCMQMARARPDPGDMFNKVDSDGSGGISQSELETFVQDISSRTGGSIDTTDAVLTYDADEDGELSQDELKSFTEDNMPPPSAVMGMGHGGGPGDLFHGLNTDSSGGISQSELDKWAGEMSGEIGNSIDTTDAISKYDTDMDDELSTDELKSFMDASGIEPAPPPPRGRGSGMNGLGSIDPSSASSAESILSAYDTDADEMLNIDELQEYLVNSDTAIFTKMIEQAISVYMRDFEGLNSYSSIDLSV